MVGRGVLKDPALIEKLAAYASGEAYGTDAKKKLPAFHDRLVADYGKEFSGDQNVLFKMKELWSYLIVRFPGKEKEAKAIRKANGWKNTRRRCGGYFRSSGCSFDFFRKKKAEYEAGVQEGIQKGRASGLAWEKTTNRMRSLKIRSVSYGSWRINSPALW